MIAFANTLGGDLYFGLNEEGKVLRLGKKEVERIARSVYAFCSAETDPVMLGLVSTKVKAVHAGG